jgi:NAD(P)-dependent dehydrogenase (short-subunit alcohol dehydrogenase family)
MKAGFAGRKVFITGGSSGIGKELARQFLLLGAKVTILSDGRDKLEVAKKELSAVSESIDSVVCDISSVAQVRCVVRDYCGHWGAPDILVNNAGYAVYQTVDEMTTDDLARLLNVNFVGACIVTREFLPAMIDQRGGSIVMMASIAGRVPMTPCGPYSAAKHGLVAWARTISAELHRFNIHVHVICPGRVETDFFLHESFVRRLPRREAAWSLPVETVARSTIAAIQKNRFLSYVPKSFALLVWMKDLLPIVADPVLQRLMRARVESVHLQRKQDVKSEHVS